jgi:hypothetical protein
MTTALPPPLPVTDSAKLCSCDKPAPHEQATHKGASRNICLNCNLPIRISF